jgi:cyclic pyranopterin phosphate synthase
MPQEGIPCRPRDEILTFEEIARVAHAAAAIGLRKLRLTGGEPLIRAGLPELVAALARIPGIEEVSLTTNGVLLAGLAEPLARAGLARINVSLDTLQPERFARITRFGRFDQVWRGIEAAERAGLTPVKLNMVVVRGLNDDELEGFARLTVRRPWNVRFIELMPIGNQGDWGANFPGEGRRFVPAAEMRGRLATLGQLLPVNGPRGNGPAQTYRLLGAAGTLGFISPVSQHFCAGCNRLRLTADGRLRPCLLRDGEVNLAPALRAGADVPEIQGLIMRAVLAKPQCHQLPDRVLPRDRGMVAVGG